MKTRPTSNYTGSHRKYRVGYLDSNGDVYFLYSHGDEFPLKLCTSHVYPCRDS